MGFSSPTSPPTPPQTLLNKLRSKGLNSLHVMVLGRPGAGKTSTVNTLLNEKVSPVTALAAQVVDAPQPYVRTVPGFTLTITDSQGITSQDAVNPAAVHEVVDFLQTTAASKPVDIFLFVERLDQYRVEPLDKEVMQVKRWEGRTDPEILPSKFFPSSEFPPNFFRRDSDGLSNPIPPLSHPCSR